MGSWVLCTEKSKAKLEMKKESWVVLNCRLFRFQPADRSVPFAFTDL